MESALLSDVAEAIQEIARMEILPRFQALSEHQIDQKTSATDLVTEADLLAEKRLSALLLDLLPESVVVGEEACHDNPQLMDAIGISSVVWVVDPLDGTANFVHGRPFFATAVALVRDGKTEAGWLYDPMNDHMFCGYKGGSVTRNGVPVTLYPSDCPLSEKAGAPGPVLPHVLEGRIGEYVHHRSAAHDYMALLSGRLDFATFRRILPWDHAAGVLLYSEIGGVTGLLDGRAYDPSLSKGFLIAASDAALWAEIATAYRSVD